MTVTHVGQELDITISGGHRWGGIHKRIPVTVVAIENGEALLSNGEYVNMSNNELFWKRKDCE